MDCLELKEVINKGKNSKTQFKSTFNSINVLAVEISAMANTIGGQIIIGVFDDGNIVGVNNLNN